MWVTVKNGLRNSAARAESFRDQHGAEPKGTVTATQARVFPVAAAASGVAESCGLTRAFALVACERHDRRCARQGRERRDGFLAPLRDHPLVAKADAKAEQLAHVRR